MNRRIRHISERLTESVKNRTSYGFEDNMMHDKEDSALFDSISEYMKGMLDIEEVKNDPAFSATKEAVNVMVSEYNKNIAVNKENENFVRDIFTQTGSGKNMTDEINLIRQEIDDTNLNKITAEWVREWHEKKQTPGASDSKTEEIRNFITSAINSPAVESAKILNDGKKISSSMSLFVRFTTLSAAALAGVFLLIRTLLPSSNPEKLFDSYYKPFQAISPVTRSINNNEEDNYSFAIESYKEGNYQRAAIGFATELQKDPSLTSSKFFLGLSELALNNYNQAANLLSDVAEETGEYGNEARWYLGLMYLKTGDKQKASECFEKLSLKDGFYRLRSEKILRRLK